MAVHDGGIAEPGKDIVVDIYFNDGEQVGDRDIPEAPFGVDGFISYWSEDGKKLITRPLSTVFSFVFRVRES